MAFKQRLSDLSAKLQNKGKALFSGSFSKEEELQSLSNELKELSPATKNTLLTLVNNSKLQGNISLPPQDQLCAQITSYAYLSPEKRPYQI